MKDGKSQDATNKFEIVQVLWVDTRVWINLKGVVVVCAVFKQTVERIEHLVRQQEKEFTRDTAIVQGIFTLELDH